MKKVLFLFLCCLLSLNVMGQTKTITGVVKEVTGEPMIGANVVEVGTTNGTITDANGKFTLKLTKPNAKVNVIYIGYTTETLDASTRDIFDVTLKEEANVLNEVVVTGYGGTQQRAKVTNSIAKVKDDVLEQGLFSNPAQALSGAVAGLKVQQTSGNPGATPAITLRGGTDFDGSGSPLVVIDGQIATMADMNPDDIESMEVMKDAGATAIYGARANNGVILITTKRGKIGKREVNVKAKFGWNFFNNPWNFMNAGDYLYYIRKSYQNAYVGGQTYPDGTPIKSWASLVSLENATPYGTGNKYFASDGVTPLDGNKTSQAIWSTMKYTDNLAFLLNQGWKTMTDPVTGEKLIYTEHKMSDFNINSPAFSQDYNVSMSAGNDQGRYYAGLGFNKTKGNAVGNWYQRLNFTLNGEYKMNNWLTSISSFNFADAKWYGLSPTQTSEENYFSRVFSVPPTFRGYNANGEVLMGANSGDGNQSYQLNKFERDNNTDKFRMTQAFNFAIMKGLDFKISANWFYSEEKLEAFNHDYMTSPGNYSTTRSTSASYERQLQQTYNAVLNYNTMIGEDHSISAMAGFEFLDNFVKGFSASGSGAPTDDFGDLGYTSTDEGKRSIDSWHTGNRVMSFFGRANYDYQSKYLFSFVIRRDGYSKLAKDNRWGWFPGVSAGWVFTKENFMEPYRSFLSYGKLRASYGVNGNVNANWIGNYTVQGSYGTNQYNGNVGFLLGNIPNPYVKWETSNTTEVGLDLGWFNNALTTNFSYYVRNTYDKFANITIPSTSGVTSFVSNNGEYQNRGLEMEFAYRFNKGDWKANASVNVAYAISKVSKLPDNGLARNRQSISGAGELNQLREIYSGNGSEKIWVGGYQQGQRPGDIYVFQADGLYRDANEIPEDLIDITSGNNGSNGRPLYGGAAGYNKLSATQKANALPISVGDVKWRDVNGDGTIDNYDLVKVGNMNPKWTGGINLSASWKNITLSARMDFALDFVVVDTRTPWIMGNMQGTYNSITDTKNTYSAENPNGKYPTYVWADQLGKRNYARASSMFVYSGDYLSFREISLSYRLPQSIVKKIGLTNVDLSVTGQNLGYWTEAPHVFSPENTLNWGGYPLPRTVILGINVTF